MKLPQHWKWLSHLCHYEQLSIWHFKWHRWVISKRLSPPSFTAWTECNRHWAPVIRFLNSIAGYKETFSARSSFKWHHYFALGIFYVPRPRECLRGKYIHIHYNVDIPSIFCLQSRKQFKVQTRTKYQGCPRKENIYSFIKNKSFIGFVLACISKTFERYPVLVIIKKMDHTCNYWTFMERGLNMLYPYC